jgi:hypothetical protein
MKKGFQDFLPVGKNEEREEVIEGLLPIVKKEERGEGM